MIVKKILSFLSLCLIMTQMQAQDKTYKQWFQEAQEYMLYEDYDKALKKYQTIENRGWLNANIAFGIGVCYMNINNQNQNAIPYLLKATANTSATYKEGNYKEQAAPEEAWFYLGKAYRLNGEYEKAINAYTEFKVRSSAADVYFNDFLNVQIQSCRIAQEMIANPLPIDFTKAGFALKGEECYFPAVAGDGKSAVFTSYQEVRDPYTGEKDFFELVFYATCDDEGNWSKPKEITYDIASDGNYETASLSFHGDMLILYRDDYGNGNLYYSMNKGGKWDAIQKFPKVINSKYNETHGSLSPDGKSLFFVSDRPGGQGGRDVYRSYIDINGNWGQPINLGPVINTPFDEDAAFLTTDSKTLFFVSEGHASMGGFDIFKSVVEQNGAWTEPQNLGYPINSAYDDVYYCPVGEGAEGYMNRYPDDGGATKEMFLVRPLLAQQPLAEEPVYTPEPEPETTEPVADVTEPAPAETYTPDPEPAPAPVYTPTYPSEYNLKGRITLQDNKDLDETFYVHVADNTGKMVAALSPDVTSGEFTTRIQPGSYKVTAYGDGYQPAEAHIYISPEELNPDVVSFVTMVPTAVSTGECYSIKSILFDDNSSRLNHDAQVEVERLLVLMKNNPGLTLEVDGNTDDRGTDDYNQRLSVLRAREVVNYLTRKGIPESRFVIKGLGKSNFVAVNDNPEGRALNRRVDLKVLNPSGANVVVEGIYVPDELKYRDQITYTIWITESNKPLPPAKFRDINNVWIFPSDDGKHYMYTFGLFKHQAEAIQMTGKIVDAGFADAHVISSIEYNQIVQKGSSVYKSKMADPDKNTYTIQILAVTQPVASSRFRGLFDVEMHKGTDGYYRYTWGEFIGKPSARQALEDILAKGFTDAFIVNVDKFE